MKFMKPGLAGLSLVLLAGLASMDPVQALSISVPPSRPPILETGNAETPVVLRDSEMRVEVVGGFAMTTIDMVFHNPNNRPLEGFLNFPLREGQTVSGFALDFDGHLRPAVPVEKGKGQQVFESIERRRVDPALLEQTAGNQFRLRIFPIPAQGTRRVQLRFVEPLTRQAAGASLRLPLDHAANVESFHLHIEVQGQGRGRAPELSGPLGRLRFRRENGNWVAESSQRNFRGNGELHLQLPAVEGAQVHTQQVEGQNYFLAEIPVEIERMPRALPRQMGLLWDSSASARRRDIGSELALLDRYFRQAGNMEVQLWRLRDKADDGGRFSIRNGDWQALRQALTDTVYDGASALNDWQPQSGIQEFLLFSDGLSNYGARSAMPALAANQSLYVLNTAGANADGRRLRAWAEAGQGEYIEFGADRLAAAVADLLTRAPRIVSEQMPGGEDLVHESATPRDGVFRIAGRMRGNSGALQLSYMAGNGQIRQIDLPVEVDPGAATAQSPVARLWAGYRVDRWSADPESNRAAIRRLGQEFGLVTGETSLIVLETVQDYVQYDILPPQELMAQYQSMKASILHQETQSEKDRLNTVVAQFEDKMHWWKRDWPKNGRNVVATADASALEDERRMMQVDAPAMPETVPPPPAPLAVAAPPAHEPNLAMTRESRVSGGINPGRDASKESGGNRDGSISIALQPWQPDSEYARRLREARADQVYRIYLDERDSYANSTAFYLDVADILTEKGQSGLALRVLSNLAELELENRHILRVLAYRLMQAGQSALAVPVLERVKRLAQEEPQSFRDLGLAYAAVGERQTAIDNLYEVVRRPWDGRFNGVALIALADLNAIIATSPQRLDTGRMDPRLLHNLPLDLRVVLSWDSDNSDMDLWVTDPNGEKCYYGNRFTYQGGRLSEDFTGGYGPEEFSLRNAKPGVYKVEANYFGSREQLVTGATSLQLVLTTHFGSRRAQEQRVTLRLKDTRETVLVGEFEVK